MLGRTYKYGVGRGHVSPGKKQSNTKRAIKEFEKWNSERYPLYDRNGENKFTAADDERFVPLYDYLNQEMRYSYYVSNKGTVLSFTFHGIKTPYVMKQTLDRRGYLLCGKGWHVHRLVWFSFATDALINGTEFPDSYGINIQNMGDLNRLARAASTIRREKAEINHIDKNTQNNDLSNLQCNKEVMHSLLHSLEKLKSEEDRLERLSKSRAIGVDKPTLIFLDDKGVSAHEIDEEELRKHMSNETIMQLESIIWEDLSRAVVPSLVKDIGWDFFGRDFYVDIIKNGSRQRYKVTKKGEDHFAVAIVGDQNGASDIVADCDIGVTYLPQYLD